MERSQGLKENSTKWMAKDIPFFKEEYVE